MQSFNRGSVNDSFLINVRTTPEASAMHPGYLALV